MPTDRKKYHKVMSDMNNLSSLVVNQQVNQRLVVEKRSPLTLGYSKEILNSLFSLEIFFRRFLKF